MAQVISIKEILLSGLLPFQALSERLLAKKSRICEGTRTRMRRRKIIKKTRRSFLPGFLQRCGAAERTLG